MAFPSSPPPPRSKYWRESTQPLTEDMSPYQAAFFNSESPSPEVNPKKHAYHISDTSTLGKPLPESPYQPSPASPGLPKKQPTIFHLWWAELGAIFISLAALFAILGIVYQYRELREAPRWYGNININTLIAILGVVLRVGLVVALAEALSQQKWLWFSKTRTLHDMAVFDQATRGTWGSLKLLFRLSSWGGIAAFGALLIILSVAIDPFTQQLVHFTTCTLPTDASIPSVPRRQLMIYSDRNSDTVQTTIPLAIQSSIYAPQANEVPIDCLSGQCLFDKPYYTLAYCSTCDDVSDQLNNTAWDSKGFQIRHLRNLTLPSGTFLFNSTGDGDEDANVYLKSQPTGMTNTTSSVVLSTANYLEAITATFEIISIAKQLNGCTDEQKRDPKLSWQCRGFGAARCSMKPCVQKLTAEVINGTVKETILDSNSNWGLDASAASVQMIQTNCLTDDQKTLIRSQGYKIDDATELVPYNLSMATPKVDGLSNVTFPQCYYSVFSTIPLDMNIALSSLLGGNTMINKLESTRIPTTLATVQRKMYNGSYTSFDHMNNFFANVSKGISIGLRQANPGGNNGQGPDHDKLLAVLNNASQSSNGTLLEERTCVEIRWPWLAYPAVMIILTTIFVLLTILNSSLHPPSGDDTSRLLDEHGHTQSQRHSLLRPAGGWKSSLLPYMFHGLDDGTLRSRDRSRLLFNAEMESEVRQMQVRLAPTKDGWKLVPNYEH